MDEKTIMVKMIMDRWNQLNQRMLSEFDRLSDEKLMEDIVPGKNRAIYILGHMIGVHDELLPLLGLGIKEYPELTEPFLSSPDKAFSELPSAGDLREILKKQTHEFSQKIAGIQPNEWFERHNSVSAEDFVKEPHRNKLNVLLTRTTHLSYHVGQLVLIK